MKSILFFLVSFIAITTTLAGLLMISNPNGQILNLSTSLLEGTPFKNFLVPGILLLTIVGSVNLLAVFHNMQRDPNRYNWALAGGIAVSVWIVGQMIMIQSVGWLHVVFLVIGIMIILTSYQLKGKWAV